jgi:hypothetical protein
MRVRVRQFRHCDASDVFEDIVSGACVPACAPLRSYPHCAGAINIVTGLGVTAGEPLTRHPSINKVAFTGSVATGSRIAQVCLRHFYILPLSLAVSFSLALSFFLSFFLSFSLSFFLSLSLSFSWTNFKFRFTNP